MQADQFYQSVLEGVIAKLNDSNENLGVRPNVIENLRQVIYLPTLRYGSRN